jgi:hypothetical protein
MVTDFGGYNMDVTSYTMILMTKLWGLSWAYKDGGVKLDTLTKDQLERKVMHLPNILEYLSFVFFSGGCLLGPFIEYSDFKDWIELTNNYTNLPIGIKGVATIKPALTRTLQGFGCLALHLAFVVGGGFYT